MTSRTSNKTGFTLIELTTAIVLVSILSVMAGMGLVQIANGYSFAKQSAVAAEQAQVTLARVSKELTGLEAINGSLTSDIKLRYSRVGTWHTLVWNPDNKILTLDDDKLIENVQSFSFTYHDTYGAAASSYSSSTSVIEIMFELKGYNDIPLPFVQRVTI